MGGGWRGSVLKNTATRRDALEICEHIGGPPLAPLELVPRARLGALITVISAVVLVGSRI